MDMSHPPACLCRMEFDHGLSLAVSGNNARKSYVMGSRQQVGCQVG